MKRDVAGNYGQNKRVSRTSPELLTNVIPAAANIAEINKGPGDIRSKTSAFDILAAGILPVVCCLMR